jgi:hypothetical protein
LTFSIRQAFRIARVNWGFRTRRRQSESPPRQCAHARRADPRIRLESTQSSRFAPATSGKVHIFASASGTLLAWSV